jgi:oxaloacetate decarboxylase gamma subunit
MTEALNAGLELMAVGMGIVFLFLITLILTANVMSKLVNRFYPETETIPAKNPTVAAGTTDPAVVAAITTAVHRYRSEK